jgi:hypothetical protein
MRFWRDALKSYKFLFRRSDGRWVESPSQIRDDLLHGIFWPLKDPLDAGASLYDILFTLINNFLVF